MKNTITITPTHHLDNWMRLQEAVKVIRSGQFQIKNSDDSVPLNNISHVALVKETDHGKLYYQVNIILEGAKGFKKYFQRYGWFPDYESAAMFIKAADAEVINLEIYRI